MARPDFLNFKVDHMTLLLQPQLYNVSFLLFRTIFGCEPEHMLYEKRKEWVKGEGEKSLTFAMNVGGQMKEDKAFETTMIAVVQPTEPMSQPSHVREMLDGHQAAAHWQHIALRTPDLMAFHEHAQSLGVNFITPILRDEEDDVIQAFTGEWFFPGIKSSGMFFEFLQRKPSESLIKKLSERNRESWFNDRTFLGLYGEKEREYQTGEVTPFIDFALFKKLQALVEGKNLWEIKEADIENAETMMRDYATKQRKV